MKFIYLHNLHDLQLKHPLVTHFSNFPPKHPFQSNPKIILRIWILIQSAHTHDDVATSFLSRWLDLIEFPLQLTRMRIEWREFLWPFYCDKKYFDINLPSIYFPFTGNHKFHGCKRTKKNLGLLLIGYVNHHPGYELPLSIQIWF